MQLSPSSSARPILLVPGAMTGAWIWADNFEQAFRSAGYAVQTMEFRGHGAGLGERFKARFGHYVDDCVNAIEAFDQAPVLIGHSLGGLIALHASARVEVAATALLSPAPVEGIGRSLLSLGRKSPVSLAKFIAATVDARLTRYAEAPLGIYSDTCDIERAQAITAQLRSESLPVLLRLLAPPRLEFNKLSPEKILFIGAKGDHIIPAAEVERSARTLGSPLKVYEGLSHTYQAESSWPMVASDIQHFIEMHL
ncbi:MAG: hypothetical protein C9356_19500 [Oleiphilus sp.]|nr:MAG: hypothetical protein C9356_19500 [Oleiphilus sp.]